MFRVGEVEYKFIKIKNNNLWILIIPVKIFHITGKKKNPSLKKNNFKLILNHWNYISVLKSIHKVGKSLLILISQKLFLLPKGANRK